ncbi:MAG: helix-turn-helix transcriptional regulator [Rickettsia endosymbiont of Labidopullus appendiculatus]|nr:helix-turn-helix transcriptional regulator [Rickettsia endosymbiont of Labidopullus appendiculatus]
MKLSIWMKVNNLQTCKVARLFQVSPAHIYKYIYGKTIPRPKVMERIFLATYGVVTPNDFYEINTELLEKKLLEQLKYKVIKK